MGARPKPRPKIAPCHMIAKLREARKWDCKDLAKELEVSAPTVTRLETDCEAYTPETIRKLCKIFKVLPNLLFTVDEEEEDVLKALQKDRS